MSTKLTIYLQNHEAAGRAGLDLARRASESQRRRAWGGTLGRIAGEIAEDLAALRALMRDLGVPSNLPLGLLLQLGERVGRLKPNGTVLRRSPLSDLLEVEALLDAVQAKAAGWAALGEGLGPDHAAELNRLTERAEAQATELRVAHREAAAHALAG